MAVAGVEIKEDRLVFAGGGYFCVFEKNPLAPGWRLWDWDESEGCHLLTPLAGMWETLVPGHLKRAKEGKVGRNREESLLIARKIEEIINCPEHEFYNNLKLSDRDREHFWLLCRGKVREESKIR